ncbi:FAD/NAD(P)-binding domain-containing protein [Peniophora sp. CONT]|nr:FAD/NAD(P)-binding domain-containing protein [Peniophora sp. CONT]
MSSVTVNIFPQIMSQLATTAPKLRVAICGGGIGGLTLANALGRTKGIAVDVYERAADFKPEIGAGLSIGPRNMPFLTGLGLVEEIAAISGQANSSGSEFSINKADKKDLEVIMSSKADGGAARVHRADFHDILFRHLPEHVELHSNTRLKSYSDSGDITSPVRLDFADGSTAECDVLVGADGVKSAVRAAVLENIASRTQDAGKAERLRASIEPRFSGATVYRAVISREQLPQVPADSSVWKSAAKIYSGGGRALVIYPISRGNKLNTALYVVDPSEEDTLHPQPWVTEVKGDELVHYVDGWAEEPRSVLAGFKGLTTKKWVVNVVKPLEEWTDGRVTLLGDAAHAMTSFLGAGAGKAIEDALVLSTLLAHPGVTRDTVRQALCAYSDVRCPIAADFYHASRRNGQLMTDSSMTPEELLVEYGKTMKSIFGRASAEDDAKRAVEKFEKAVAA